MYIFVQPIRLISFDILYPIGILSKTTSTIFAASGAIFVGIFGIFIDTALMPFIERHFQITKVINLKAKRQRKLIYGLMIFTWILSTVSLGVFFSSCVDNDRAYKLIYENLHNSDIILSSNPSMLIFDTVSTTTGITVIIFLSSYSFYRLLLMIWIILQNLNYSKTLLTHTYKVSQKRFQLMFQTTLIQILTFIGFGIPCILMLFLSLCPTNWLQFFQNFFENLPLIFLCSAGIAILYPSCFCIIALYFIKPYKNAVKNLYLKVLR